MRFLLIIILVCFNNTVWAQQLPFAAHSFSDLLVNSSQIAADRDASLTLLHRTQGLAGGRKLFSNYLSGKLPVINRRNNLLAFGLGYIENRYKAPASFMDQTVNGSIAYGFKMRQGVELAFAMDMAMVINKVDLSNVATGSMWLPELGFDPGISSGENFENNRILYGKLSSSIFLRTFDRYNNDRFVLGLSVGQLNKRKNSFSNQELSVSAPEISIISGFRLAQRDNVEVAGRVLVNHFSQKSYVKIGLDVNYGLYRYNKQNAVKENSVNIGAYFDFTKGGQILLQYRQPKYVIGLAYSIDTNMGIDNRIYNNAVEVLLVVRNPMKPKNYAMRMGKINGLKRIKKKNQKRPEPKVNQEVLIASEQVVQADSTLNQDSLTTKPDVKPEPAAVTVEEKYKSEEEQAWRASIGLGDYNQLTFETNSIRIGKDSRQVLFHLARVLKEFEGSFIILVGHTDNVGSYEDNLELSLNRAASVKEELVKIGVEPGQIKLRGMGEVQPIGSNETEAGRQQNRRVEFIILKGSPD